MGYLYLALPISLELIGTTCLKYSEGFTKLYPSLATLAAYGLCFYLFSKSLLYLHLSIAYAIWCAIGIVAATLISVFLFNEALSPAGYFAIALIVAGVIILNLLARRIKHNLIKAYKKRFQVLSPKPFYFIF